MVILAACFFSSCEPDDGSGGDDMRELIVVEGFVYANEPVNRIQLSKFHESGRSQTIPLSDAFVALEQAGRTFALQVSDSSPGVYVQTDTSEVLNGAGRVDIKIYYGGMQYAASAPMPAEITGLQISEAEIDLEGSSDNEVLTELSWDPHPGGLYCVFLRNIEGGVPLGGPGLGAPTETQFGRVLTGHSMELTASHFPSVGSFALYVTVVNEDYARLYGTSSGMNLTANSGNISGGVGVFTAFNGASVIVDVQ